MTVSLSNLIEPNSKFTKSSMERFMYLPEPRRVNTIVIGRLRAVRGIAIGAVLGFLGVEGYMALVIYFALAYLSDYALLLLSRSFHTSSRHLQEGSLVRLLQGDCKAQNIGWAGTIFAYPMEAVSFGNVLTGAMGFFLAWLIVFDCIWVFS